MKTKLISVAVLLWGMCSGCSDWLDVKPSDRISEESAFSTIAGFKQALNGIYVELNKPELYGASLTCEFVEVLAQLYSISPENKGNYEVAQYNYTGSFAKGKISSIWETAYNLIANTNLLLKNCELNREVLPDDYYHLCKGEALALRGMLHFDLFRLFGPIYTRDSALNSIPYYTEFALEVNPSLSGVNFMEAVFKDLHAAELELEDDPVKEFGVAGDGRDKFFQFRNLRLNYYAVQALLARAYYYTGNDAKALEYAEKVIAVQEEKFPWVDPTVIGAAAKNPDRVFSSELIFSLQNLSRQNLFTSYFDGNNLNLQSLLSTRAYITKIFYQQDQGDYRYKSFLSTSVEQGGETYSIFTKYQGQDSLYNQMIPMIRIGEMYLIASEACGDRVQGARTYLNVLLKNRGKRPMPYLNQNEMEWLRELYGEGQMFYYYKRNRMQFIRSANTQYGDPVEIKMSNYVLPVPDGETQYN